MPGFDQRLALLPPLVHMALHGQVEFVPPSLKPAGLFGPRVVNVEIRAEILEPVVDEEALTFAPEERGPIAISIRFEGAANHEDRSLVPKSAPNAGLHDLDYLFRGEVRLATNEPVGRAAACAKQRVDRQGFGVGRSEAGVGERFPHDREMALELQGN